MSTVENTGVLVDSHRETVIENRRREQDGGSRSGLFAPVGPAIDVRFA